MPIPYTGKCEKHPQSSQSWLGIFKGSLTDVVKTYFKRVKPVSIYSSFEELRVPLMECLNLSFLHLNSEFKLLSSILNAPKEASFPFLFYFSITCLTMTPFLQHSQISVGKFLLWWKSHRELPSCIQPNLLQQTAVGNLTNPMGGTIWWSSLLWHLFSASRVGRLLQPSTSQCLLSISGSNLSILAVPPLSFYFSLWRYRDGPDLNTDQRPCVGGKR